MSLTRFLLIIALVGLAVSNSARSQTLHSSTIVVDEEHSQLAPRDGSEPPQYVVRAADSIKLDVSNYLFPANADYGVSGPDLISVILGRDRKYRIPWTPGVVKYVLSKDTLRPEAGSLPFSGFKPGETFSIIIAFEDANESRPSAVMIKMLWGCLVTAQ